MNKFLYYAGIAVGLGLLIYFYVFNFDNMSETKLVNSVLYWYVPFVFGIYGLTALRVKKKMPADQANVLSYSFSGKDSALLLTMVLVLVLSGLIGFVLFIIPVAMFKVHSKNFDISVAIIGTLLWLLLLWLFFKMLWPSL